MEVGRLTRDWFSILVGDTVDYTEIRGWRKTGRPKQLNPSFTELKTVRCIIHGPELEEVYKIPNMLKPSFVDRTLSFTSRMLGKTTQSASSSKFSDTPITELIASQNQGSMDMSKAIVSDEIKESTSSAHGGESGSLLTDDGSDKLKLRKTMVILSYLKFKMVPKRHLMELSRLPPF
ncbi:hypothetical protein L2E82_39106 [Cichorium intybus]|uniref:Uncharacterized protein n=1 Tax=Cichorium intybus TaxID=13427 RepID=A0ACB9AIL4_CICIN|nr:hypothetical protein L2E82_39106 [Cichorium intybus]